MSRLPFDSSKATRQSSDKARHSEEWEHLSDEISRRRSARLLFDANSAAALAHKLRLTDVATQHRIALHRSHFDPNQPRVAAGHPDGGQWTSEGKYAGRTATADSTNSSISSRSDLSWNDLITGPTGPEVHHTATRVDIGDALTGISTIDETTVALTNILARAADTVNYLPGLSPQTYGTLVHTAFAAAVRVARLPGIGFWDVETTFSLEADARYGSKDSIRTDVVLRNEVGEIIAIYDVKTGESDLSRKRINELLAKTRAAPSTPIIQLHLIRGPSRKAERIEPNSRVRQASAQTQINVRRI